jgi:hypothetical protein
VPKRTFQDADLGKFTWSAMKVWEGAFEVAPGKKVRLTIGSDPSDDHPPPAADALPGLMPKVKRFLDRVRKQNGAWREQAEEEIQGELTDYLEMLGMGGWDPDADVEPIDEGLTLQDVELYVTPKSGISAIIRYIYSILVGGHMTVDWFVEVEIDGRGQYRGARLDEV